MNEKQAFVKFTQADKCSASEFALAKKYAKEHSSIEVEQLFNKLYAIVKNVLEETVNSNYHSVHDAKYIYERFGISREYFDKILNFFLKKNSSLSITRRYYKTIRVNHSIDLEKVYNDLKKHFWSVQYAKQLALKYGFTFLEFNFLITFFAQEKNDIPYTSFKEYQLEYVTFYKMLNGQVKTRVDKEHAYNYMRNYASSKEKELFEAYATKILSNMRAAANQNMNANKYLEAHHLNDYDLYIFLTLCPNLEKHYMNFIYFRFESYYRYCRNTRMDTELIAQKAKLKQMDISEFINLGQIYAHNIINTDLYQQAPHKNFTSKAYQALERIVDENDPQVIKKVLIDNHITTQNIVNFCYSYHSEYSLEKQDALEVKLLSYLKDAKTTGQAKIPEIPQNIEDILKTYIKSGLSLESCCSMYQYSCETVSDYLKGVSNNSIVNQAKEKYKLEKENEKKNKAMYYHKLYLQLFSYIQNGIMVNGVNRAFTLVDYFCLFPDAKLHSRRMYMMALTNEEKTAINVFFAPLSLAKDLFSKDLIQTTFEFNALKDENGLPVINSGNMLNQDAIIQIVDYFEQNKIPLNTVTFNTALQLYSANTLFLNEDTLQNDRKTLK